MKMPDCTCGWTEDWEGEAVRVPRIQCLRHGMLDAAPPGIRKALERLDELLEDDDEVRPR